MKKKKWPATWDEFHLWIRRQSFHLVFISSLLALTTLVAWWAVFINRSIEESHNFKIESAVQNVQTYAFFMKHSKAFRPSPGVFSHDNRLEVVTSPDLTNSHAQQLLPAWHGYWLQPGNAWINELDERHRRRRIMIVGESALLVILILVSGFMIYRMYWLEKRTTRELHEFWSRVSHEIKTPITGLKAFLQTLWDQPLSREEMEPLLKLALRQVERQKQLAENMLIGQKLKRRGVGMEPTTLNLRSFFQQYLDQYSPYPADNSIAFTCPETVDIMVRVDAEALRIIVDNIIDNAVKYAGPKPELSIEVRNEGKKAVVVFEDNGPGFESGTEENIFRAYKRLGKELPKGQHGTGMGLYISRRLARKMGGDLTAQSTEHGARFTLYLKS
jgi:signal transduction histidine kinase